MSATSCARRSRRCAPSTSCSSRAPARTQRHATSSCARAAPRSSVSTGWRPTCWSCRKLDSGLVALDLRDDDLRSVAESADRARRADGRSQGRQRWRWTSRPSPSSSRTTRRASARCSPTSSATPSSSRRQAATCEVGLEPTAEGARFTVADDGVGIDPDELEHVFDRFYRGTRMPEERASGSGLGLAIVRSIVDMHDGRVAITSRPDAGTTVEIDLPVDVQRSSPRVAPA